ncbi:MAG: hypothetical protein FJW20_25565 [Acidimicrobiia bacterium]|nr:hypothetical protein [Acidimicrobiia bacterium]
MRLIAALLLLTPAWGRFELAGPRGGATLLVAAGEAEPVKLAAADLVSDVRKITGKTLRVVQRAADCARPCLRIETRKDGRWEAYRISESPEGLSIEGSDPRGTMFGIYALLEQYVGVDPLYFWTGREPVKRATLAWDRVKLDSGEPQFRYRGWFINDEDLLTEWKDGGGKRDIDYPFYHQVTHPDVLARVFEAALRLRFNLIIPASFTDIANPAEERMVQEATRRGLMVSMHHVEPMGVSGFAFNNYWKARGKSVPYAFHSQRAAFEEVWRWYAAKWAQYPGVVWQLGLRGVADRPAWYHDKTAPQTDEARGAMISEAMKLQREIIASIAKRPAPPMTTTLWMEGAELNQRGLLRIPEGVTVVFADNTPGWKMQADFHETPREATRKYGIYYHHAVWGWGPHLVQGVPPWKTEQIFREAVGKQSSHYAILNVSNVREFALGLAASGRMLWSLDGFDGRRYLRQWCAERFAGAPQDAEAAYRQFFEAYHEDPEIGTPALLDGTSLAQGRRLFAALLRRLQGKGEPARPPEESLLRFLPSMPNPSAYPLPKLLDAVVRQRRAVEAAGHNSGTIAQRLNAADREFFESNFMAQQKMFAGILGWLECAVRANMTADRAEIASLARRAAGEFERIRTGQRLASRGEWRDWYRGDRKMNLAPAEKVTQEVLALAERKAGEKE